MPRQRHLHGRIADCGLQAQAQTIAQLSHWPTGRSPRNKTHTEVVCMPIENGSAAGAADLPRLLQHEHGMSSLGEERGRGKTTETGSHDDDIPGAV